MSDFDYKTMVYGVVYEGRKDFIGGNRVFSEERLNILKHCRWLYWRHRLQGVAKCLILLSCEGILSYWFRAEILPATWVLSPLILRNSNSVDAVAVSENSFQCSSTWLGRNTGNLKSVTSSILSPCK